MKITLPLFMAACLAFVPHPTCAAAEMPPVEKEEVVVYGGTPAGVMAAVAAAKHGHSVALVDVRLDGVVLKALQQAPSAATSR